MKPCPSSRDASAGLNVARGLKRVCENRKRNSRSFFWIQSMVRGDAQRTLLFDLDNAAQRVNRDMPSSPAAVQLTVIYHNLLRQWAEV
jgi:predicted 2-oxoglutarate/Fe(II)-dependent dioxygenase YbiX